MNPVAEEWFLRRTWQDPAWSIDEVLSRLGLDGLAQVNLGVRKHRNRSLLQVGVMARQILAAALARCAVPDAGGALTQFVQIDGEWLPSTTGVGVADRPPMREVLVR